MINQNNNVKFLIALILAVLIFIGSNQSTGAITTGGWKQPTAMGPSDNIATPINTTEFDQIKAGGLSIGKTLKVAGKLKAVGGLQIETMTSNPVSPEAGRIWLIK